jgi:hypothetical protein
MAEKSRDFSVLRKRNSADVQPMSISALAASDCTGQYGHARAGEFMILRPRRNSRRLPKPDRRRALETVPSVRSIGVVLGRRAEKARHV